MTKQPLLSLEVLAKRIEALEAEVKELREIIENNDEEQDKALRKVKEETTLALKPFKLKGPMIG